MDRFQDFYIDKQKNSSTNAQGMLYTPEQPTGGNLINTERRNKSRPPAQDSTALTNFSRHKAGSELRKQEKQS